MLGLDGRVLALRSLPLIASAFQALLPELVQVRPFGFGVLGCLQRQGQAGWFERPQYLSGKPVLQLITDDVLATGAAVITRKVLADVAGVTVPVAHGHAPSAHPTDH